MIAIEVRFACQRAHHVHSVDARSAASASASSVGLLPLRGRRLAFEIGDRGFHQAARDGESRQELEIAQRFARQIQRIGESGQGVLVGRRIFLPFAECASQRDQVRGEIARVHRGDIARIQGPQVLCVVPVIEMTAVLLHPPQCAECRLDAIECIAQATPAEVARRDDRQ